MYVIFNYFVQYNVCNALLAYGLVLSVTNRSEKILKIFEFPWFKKTNEQESIRSYEATARHSVFDRGGLFVTKSKSGLWKI